MAENKDMVDKLSNITTALNEIAKSIDNLAQAMSSPSAKNDVTSVAGALNNIAFQLAEISKKMKS
jgi:tetrahydromethanopterin S-methyltransferase subunit B